MVRDQQVEPYDSWEQFEEQMRLFAECGPKNQEDFKAYNPSPKEVKRRIKFLNWLKKREFSDKLQDSIMIHDCPTPETVRRMVASVGLEETKRRLENFLKDED